jgi:hypothetical protein
MDYKIRIDVIWIIIFILVSLMTIIFSLILIIFIIEYLQTRLNCICICRGIRLSRRYSFLSIPLFCICRRRYRNTLIVPIKVPKLYTTKEYCQATGNKIIIDPDNSFYIGYKL